MSATRVDACGACGWLFDAAGVCPCRGAPDRAARVADLEAALTARVAELERERQRLARELDDARQEAAHQRLRRIEWTACANDLRAEANDLHGWLAAALEDGLAECERLRAELAARDAGGR